MSFNVYFNDNADSNVLDMQGFLKLYINARIMLHDMK